MMIIRAMQAKDAEDVAAIESRTFSQPWSRQGFLDSLELDNTIFLVAEEDNRILGYIGMYFSLDEGEVTNVAVDSDARCHGIGALLVEAMKKEAGLRGLTQIVLEVRVSNETAIRLYERNGFVSQGIRKGFYDMPKEDAYIMVYGQ